VPAMSRRTLAVARSIRYVASKPRTIRSVPVSSNWSQVVAKETLRIWWRWVRS